MGMMRVVYMSGTLRLRVSDTLHVLTHLFFITMLFFGPILKMKKRAQTIE